MTSLTAVIPVYRDAQLAIVCAKALLHLKYSRLNNFEVLIVDDGSGDETPEIIDASLPQGARLMRLPANVGRACARNAGAAGAAGDILLFIDCDCLPISECFLQNHLLNFRAGIVASTGRVIGTGLGFWHEFQVMSSKRREEMHKLGISYSGSTQNLMVRRDAFIRIGGFDENYRAYGFEDRDLLLRLEQLGSIAWSADATVEHHDALNLSTICHKMKEAGKHTAPKFRMQHPQAYRALGYEALDATVHPGRGLLALAVKPLTPALIELVSYALEWRWLPFSWRSFAVRSLSGISFILGSVEAKKDHIP